MLSDQQRKVFNGYIQCMRKQFPEKNSEPWTDLKAAIMRDGDTGVLPEDAAFFLLRMCDTLYIKATEHTDQYPTYFSVSDYVLRQPLIWFNKVDHKWNVTDLEMELDLLRKEVDEVEGALAKGDISAILEELADVVIYCYGMAEIAGASLDQAIFQKMQVNTRRVYRDGQRVGE